MAFPKLWNPGMGGLVQDQPTRLRIPLPMYGNQYSSSAASQPYKAQGSVGGIAAPPRPSPMPQSPQNRPPQFGTRMNVLPKQMPTDKLEISPYMETIYKSIQNIDPEQRQEYLQTTAASIKDRLDRYEFRLARGMPLTAEQQRQYESIRNAYNDIQKYINNPQPYDDAFAQRQASYEAQEERNLSPSGPDVWRNMRASGGFRA